MRIKRRAAAAVLLAAFLAASGTPSGATSHSESDVHGPACADVVNGSGGFASNKEVVGLRLLLAAPSCRHIAYTIYVLDNLGATEPLATQTVRGDGTSELVGFTVPLSPPDDDDDGVCVYATSGPAGGPHVFDRAPNEDDVRCAEWKPGSGGTTKFR